MESELVIIGTGTLVFLFLGIFIAFMTFTYQKRRQQHYDEVTNITEAYQKEIMKAQLEMQEQTFLSISQEIHDNVGQHLSLVRLYMSTMEDKADPVLSRKIKDSKELLDVALGDLRHLSKRLNSKYLDKQALSELLRLQLDYIQKAGVVSTHFEVSGEEREINPEKKLIVFRIAQEALQNVMRHARAHAVRVQLEYSGIHVRMEIIDDGQGFLEPLSFQNGRNPGTGVHNMVYRAKIIGGHLVFGNNPDKGGHVLLNLPL